MSLNRDKFFSSVRSDLFSNGISQSQVDGINAVFDLWNKFTADDDLRWLGYELATAYHETAQTMQPIEEYGHGRGRAYGVPTGPWHQIYDGRGLVQETWIYNYQKADTELKKLGIIDQDIDLVKNPELMLQADIAGATLIIGMKQGWFTGKKLSDYFDADNEDPEGARHIINGSDKASLIAGYYDKFCTALGLDDAAK